MYANELRRMLEAGLMSPQDLQPNELAMLVGEMPQPNYDIPKMQQNTMRFESGPDQGRVVNLDFAQQPQQQAQKPAQKLGERIEVVGKGMGRYSPDGRSVVFADGSTQDLHPEASMQAFLDSFKRQKAEQDLKQGDLQLRTGEHQLAAAQQPQQPKPQAAPMGYQFKPDGSGLMPIPGGPADLKAGAEGEKRQGAIETGEDAIRKIDDILAHPGFRGAVGTAIPGIDGLTMPGARFVPGTDAADFSARLDEIKGGAFLKAFETLKGGGQITQVEGEKATAAITRMSLAQSENEFVKAAKEFQNYVRKGVERAKAGGTRSGSLAGAPQVGEVRKGYQYKGGDPSNPSSWMKVQ
jgi:hypothetical protein